MHSLLGLNVPYRLGPYPQYLQLQMREEQLYPINATQYR